jgi:hypothetical protein
MRSRSARVLAPTAQLCREQSLETGDVCNAFNHHPARGSEEPWKIRPDFHRLSEWDLAPFRPSRRHRKPSRA